VIVFEINFIYSNEEYLTLEAQADFFRLWNTITKKLDDVLPRMPCESFFCAYKNLKFDFWLS
jgi:hypothetical protein